MPTPRKKSSRRVPAAPDRSAEKPDKPANASKQAPRSGKTPAGKGGNGKGKAAPKSARSTGPINPDSMPADVIEFITAVDDYKRKHGRPFPSWSEILEVVKGLGYRKAG